MTTAAARDRLFVEGEIPFFPVAQTVGFGLGRSKIAGRLRRRRRTSLLAGQLVHQRAQRQLAGEPKPECSARWFESLPYCAFYHQRQTYYGMVRFTHVDGRRVASGESMHLTTDLRGMSGYGM
jgi:hypothetical protein